MSFSSEVKQELCRVPLSRKSCAQAECYGVLLYCNTFSPREIRVITESDSFAQRLPQLLRRAFRFSFDRLPDGEGKHIFAVEDPASSPLCSSCWGGTTGPRLCTSTSACWRRSACLLYTSDAADEL